MPSRLFALSPLICAVVGCASSPGEQVLKASELAVRVADSVPSGCAWLLNISATDGAVAAKPAAKPFSGTREGATAKLQKLAAAYGADLIVINQGGASETIGFDGARGSEIGLGASAYRCEVSQ